MSTALLTISRAPTRSVVVSAVLVAFLTSAGAAWAGRNPNPGDIAAVSQYRESLPTSGGSNLSTPAKPAKKAVVVHKAARPAAPAPQHSYTPPAPTPAPTPAPAPAPAPVVPARVADSIRKRAGKDASALKKITTNPLYGAPARQFKGPPAPPPAARHTRLANVGFWSSFGSATKALFADAGQARLLGLLSVMALLTVGGAVLAARSARRRPPDYPAS
jgi:hypothetical protein